jgi:hypothetical protein
LAWAMSIKAMIVVLVLGIGGLAYLFLLAARTDCYESRRDRLGLLGEGMVDTKNRFKIIMWCVMHGNPPGGWPIDSPR